MAVGRRARMGSGRRSARRGMFNPGRDPRGVYTLQASLCGLHFSAALQRACRRQRDPEISCLRGPGAAVWNGAGALSADRARNLQRLRRLPCKGASNARLSRWQNEIRWRGRHQRRTPVLHVAVSGGCRDDLGACYGNRVLRCVLFVDCAPALTRWVRLCIALSSVHLKLGQRC